MARARKTTKPRVRAHRPAPAPVSVPRSPHTRTIILMVILAFVVLFGSYAARVAYEDWRILGATTATVHYTVTSENRIGFKLNTNDIAFGKIVPGGGGTRTITLTAAEPVIAALRLSPDLNRVIIIEPNPVLLDPGAPVNVTLDLSVPVGTALGNYTGELTITYLRRLPWE